MADKKYKHYIGDGVYFSEDGYGFTLTTENGLSVTNTIFFEPEVFVALCIQVQRMLDRYNASREQRAVYGFPLPSSWQPGRPAGGFTTGPTTPMLATLALLAALSSPVTHTELLPNGLVLQVHQDCSVTLTTVETVAADLDLPLGPLAIFEPGEVVFEWKNADGVTCRARVDCVTLKYKDCVERALALRKLMRELDPVPAKSDG